MQRSSDRSREVGDHLRTATTSLSSALRSGSARGLWGEVQLRRVVESAGMTAHVDFREQVASNGTTADGERFMNEHRDELLSLPGTLANVGGVGTSGIERKQNSSGKAIGRRASTEELREMMYGTFDRVFERHQSGTLSMRAATDGPGVVVSFDLPAMEGA